MFDHRHRGVCSAALRIPRRCLCDFDESKGKTGTVASTLVGRQDAVVRIGLLSDRVESVARTRGPTCGAATH